MQRNRLTSASEKEKSSSPVRSKDVYKRQERTGDDVARASVRRRAGFVDVFAHPVGELEVVLQILFARRFFPCIIVLNGAAVEVELGVIDGALVQRRFIDPAVLRIVVFRLGFIGVEFALLIVEMCIRDRP